MLKINRLLIVAGSASVSGDLLDSLQALGISEIDTITTDQDIYARVSASSPEAVIMEVDILETHLLEQINSINQNCAVPVILFTGCVEDMIIEKAIRYGVATYIVGTIEANRIQTILQVAVTRYHQTRKLEQDLQETRAQLQERKIIDKAKGIIMQHKQCSEDEAYQSLRKMAMDKNMRIVDIADNIISTFAMLN